MQCQPKKPSRQCKISCQEFGLDLEKHVVACVTDGASVMVKFGKIIDCDHQLCYAHGIHLAVCDGIHLAV